MSVRNQYIKVGDKLRYLGGDEADLSGRPIEGEEYVVIKIDRDGDYIIKVPCASYAENWYVYKDGYNSDCFEPVRQQLDIKSVKVGDKVRYLGGDPAQIDSLTVGDVYEIFQVSEMSDGYIVAKIKTDYDYNWNIGELNYNLECFELIGDDDDDKDGEERLDTDDAIDLIVNLSKEVADLRKRLEVVEDSGRIQGSKIEMLIDDIVMLDERTQGESEDGRKLLKKEVYIYDAE